MWTSGLGFGIGSDDNNNTLLMSFHNDADSKFIWVYSKTALVDYKSWKFNRFHSLLQSIPMYALNAKKVVNELFYMKYIAHLFISILFMLYYQHNDFFHNNNNIMMIR